MSDTEIRLECARLADGSVALAQKIYDFVTNRVDVKEQRVTADGRIVETGVDLSAFAPGEIVARMSGDAIGRGW